MAMLAAMAWFAVTHFESPHITDGGDHGRGIVRFCIVGVHGHTRILDGAIVGKWSGTQQLAL